MVRGEIGYIIDVNSEYSTYFDYSDVERLEIDSIEYELKIVDDRATEHILRHVKPNEIEFVEGNYGDETHD